MAECSELGSSAYGFESRGEDFSLSSDNEERSEELGSSAYCFEPRRVDFPSIASSSDDEDNASDDDTVLEDDTANRIGNTSWCACLNCVPLPTEPECCCCQELPHLSHVLNNPVKISCIVTHPEFAAACLQPLILRLALIGFMSMRGDRPEFPISNR